jgi:hypothetical protein
MAAKYTIYETSLDNEPAEILERPSISQPSAEIKDDKEIIKASGCCQHLLNKNKNSNGGSLKMHKVIKILVIGPGNSGKSTILKQMNIIHGKSYPEKERKKYKYYVIMNILDSVMRLVNAMRSVFNLKFEKEQVNEKNFNIILEAQQYLETYRDLQSWQQNLKKYKICILTIWNDSSISIAYQNRNKFFFNDSTE